jgi:23S rRNA (adenine2503-C2)-methyltransferase
MDMRMQTDSNIKMAVPLADGLIVEAVWYGSGTLCISSQAGCAVGCPFCASGTRGLVRNLVLEEMLQQLAAARRRGLEPQRVTVSGIGEPLHNPQPVRDLMEDCRRQGMPVSVTTTGGPLGRLAEFLAMPHNGVMLSLHAGTAATHRRLVPRGPDFEALWRLLGELLSTLPRRRRRKLGINYLLLAGANDDPLELEALAKRLQPFPDLTLHLLTCNPVPGSSLQSPPPAAVDAAHAFLAARGLNARRANHWRRQASGGCGTLYVQSPAAPLDELTKGKRFS